MTTILRNYAGDTVIRGLTKYYKKYGNRSNILIGVKINYSTMMYIWNGTNVQHFNDEGDRYFHKYYYNIELPFELRYRDVITLYRIIRYDDNDPIEHEICTMKVRGKFT